MAGWVKFNGISSEAFGLKIESMPAEAMGKRRIDSVPIPGRSGLLHLDDETYDAVPLAITFNMNGTTRTREVMQWLDGAGYLILSDSPQYRRKAVVLEGPQFKRRRLGSECYDSFTVKFECEPFLYMVMPIFFDLTEAKSIVNPFNCYSEPLIVVYGTGDVELHIQDRTISLDGMTDPVIIDCNVKWAYVSSPDNQVAITLDDELWPILIPSSNAISWVGEVSKVHIEPEWRCL